MRTMKLVLLLIISISIPSIAEETAKAKPTAQPAPHQKIEKATDNLLTLIDEAKEYFEKDPERYYQGIEKIMDDLIDFPSFTRSVMGPFGTRDYYKSLKSKEERQLYKDNYKRFVHTFREGLINTYGKGMLAFNGEKVEILPATEADKELVKSMESVEVIQKINGDDEVYQVIYKMRPNKEGDWLLRNVSIGSVNIGSLYRNQFIASMDKYNSDFAKVIDNWVIEAQINEKEAKTAEASN